MVKNISWEDFDNLCYSLANKIQASGKQFKSIYGIPRGGLIVAVKLSHILGIPFKEDADLVVDDICDSGKTLEGIKKHTATLHFRVGASVKPNFYVEEKKDEWIKYPWEV